MKSSHHHKSGCTILSERNARVEGPRASTRRLSCLKVPNLSAVFLYLAIATVASAQSLPPGTTSPDAPSITPLARAEAAIAEQNYASAKSQLLILTAKSPTDARSLYDLGYVCSALHDATAAEAAYRAAIAADPNQFESHAALGLLLFDSNPTEAHTQLLAATRLTPATDAASARATVLRALAQLDLDTAPATASDEILAAIQLTPQTPADLYLIAQIADNLADATDALATYNRVIADPAADPALVSNAQTAVAAILIHQNKLADAETLLSAALQSAPDSPALSAQLARVYTLQGSPDKAAALLAAVHTANPQDAATTRMLADAYNRSNRPAEADTLYAQLIAASPSDITLLIDRGTSLIRQQKFAQAQTLLQHADALFLATPSALPSTDDRLQLTGSLAFAASENAEPAACLAALDQRLQYGAETPSTLFLRATAHDHLHHIPQARSFYSQFLAASRGQFPDEEWQARHRLIALAHDK